MRDVSVDETWKIGADWRTRFAGGRALARKAGLLAALLGTALALTPAGAAAEPVCTDTWTGPSGGEWTTAGDWSSSKVPTSTDVACIGAGTTVNVTEGANQTGVLLDKGTLAISGGSLELANALEVSSAANLLVSHGTLKGSGEVDVTSSFTGGGSGKLSGTGSTVIEPGASGTITAGSGAGLSLEERTLRNTGTLTVGKESGLSGSKKAQLVNSGTLIVNGETAEEGRGLIAGEGEATLTNTGTLKKTEGTGKTQVQFVIKNENSVIATAGKLEFTGGGTSGEHTAGSWSASGTGTGFVFNTSGGVFALGATAPMSGSVEVKDGLVTAGKIEGATASLTINGRGLAGVGTLEVNGASASTVQNLTLTDEESRGGGVLKGSSEIDVTGSFTGGLNGSMSGTGSTVIESGATGAITASSGTGFSINERTLKNSGTLTVGKESGLGGSKNAQLVNSGTLIVNGETASEGHGLIAGEGEAKLTNTGTLEKTEGTGTTVIQFGVENLGSIVEQTGKFEFVYPVFLAEPSTQ